MKTKNLNRIFVCLLSLCFFSCTNESDYMFTEQTHYTLTKPNKTVEELSEYNDSIKYLYPKTRSARNYIYKADVLGAIDGISLGSSFMFTTMFAGPGIGIASTLAGGLTLGCFYSAYAATHCRGYMISCSEENAYNSSKQYLNANSIMTDSCFVLSVVPDSIITQINIPNHSSDYKYIGIAHNQILNSLATNVIIPLSMGPIDEPIYTDYPKLINQIFNDDNFRELYYNHANTIINCSTDNDIDYSDLLINSDLSANVRSAIELFFDGFDMIPHNVSSMTLYINSYISIIENNNEFTSEECQQLYSGFLVALYSSLYWDNFNAN